MAKILLVEDDKDLALVVQEWLRAQEYDVHVRHDGLDAWTDMMSGAYNLIIMDWSLPGLSGVEICRRYRAAQGPTPVLLVTGRAETDDLIEGLDAGADDYMTKPFSMRELSARVRALRRRPAMVFNQNLRVGDLEMDPCLHVLWQNSKPTQLLPKDFAVLEFFMRYPDQILSPQDILFRVWSVDTAVSLDAVRTSIKRLRKKLDKGDDEKSSIIETVARVGYRMRAAS